MHVEIFDIDLPSEILNHPRLLRDLLWIYLGTISVTPGSF